MAPEPVRWLIDGNNVMGSRPDGWWRDRPAAARRLVADLQRHPWPDGAVVTVVFDGPGWAPGEEAGPGGDDAPPAAEGVVGVVHAGRRRSADDAIVDLAGRHEDPVVVVTSDRALRERVKALGAEVVASRALLERIGHGRADRPR